MSRPALILAGLLASTTLAAAPAPNGSYQRIDGGVLVSPASGPARRVRLTVHGDGIIHVVASPGADMPGEASLMVGDRAVDGRSTKGVDLLEVRDAPAHRGDRIPGSSLLETQGWPSVVSLAVGANPFGS